jgi:hypothetical protein
VGVGNPALFQAALQPGHVVIEAKQVTGVHRHHFVYAVAKDEAPVHHADLCQFGRVVYSPFR